MADDVARGQDPRDTVRFTRPAEPTFRSSPATRAAIDTRLARLVPGTRVRQDGLWPFLLIRDHLGDSGRSRITREAVQSPDILVVEGDVATLAGGPPTTAPRRNVAHTVFVHVWNLGRLPAIGVQLTVHATAGTAPPALVGITYLDLPDRTDPACHAVFRLPALFTPTHAPGTQVRLVARVSCLFDLYGPEDQTNPNRHRSELRVTVQA